MKITFKCPFCNANLDADIDQPIELSCPVCQQIFNVSPDQKSSDPDSALLDPTDPAGYFNNFPPEDDF